MTIYKETKDYKLIHDNMLNMANYIEDGTIDCETTDRGYIIAHSNLNSFKKGGDKTLG